MSHPKTSHNQNSAKKMAFKLILLLIFVELSIARDPRLDKFILALTWPPGYCQTQILTKPPAERCRNNYPLQPFTIHGLWGNDQNNVEVIYCENSQSLNARKLIGDVPTITTFWPDLMTVRRPYLWVHQWTKHGTCFYPSPPLQRDFHLTQYFRLGLSLYGRIHADQFMAALLANGLSPKFLGSTNRDAFAAVIKATAEVNPLLLCRDVFIPEIRRPNRQLLVGMHFCLNITMHFVDCPPPAFPTCSEDKFLWLADTLGNGGLANIYSQGVEVKPGNPYPYHSDNVQGKLHVTQATLGIGSSTEKCILQCASGHKSPVFWCSPLPSRIESCSLNLEFDEEDLLAFSVIGPQSIHLSGYFESDNGEDLLDDYEYDSYGEGVGTADSSEYDSEDGFNGIFDDSDTDMYPSSPVPNGKKAAPGKKVSVKYIGKLKKDGKIFDCESTGGGGTLQIWRMSDLIYRPEDEVLAELEKFKSHVVACASKHEK